MSDYVGKGRFTVLIFSQKPELQNYISQECFTLKYELHVRVEFSSYR